MNAAVNYQVKRHFQDSNIVSVLEGESRVSIQNLRAIYGEIATHFFCPNRASFPRFLSSQLGHLINDEAIDNSNSSSTEHYFHYYLVDEDGQQIDSVGILLEESESAPKNYSTENKVNASQNQHPVTSSHTILNLSASVIERFQTWKGDNMSENDALVSLIEKAEKSEKLEQELRNDDAVIHGLTTKLNSAVMRASLSEELEQKLRDAHAQISSLETKLASAMKQVSLTKELEQKLHDAHAHISSLEAKLDSLIKPPQLDGQQIDQLSLSSNSELANSNDAILLLVRSMSALTSKFDLFLDRQLFTEQSQSQLSTSYGSFPSSGKKDHENTFSTNAATSNTKKSRQPRQSSTLKTQALFDKAIDTIIAYNDRAEQFEDKWYIGINPLKDISNNQATINAVIERRKDEIDQHNQKHGLDRFHNGNYHRKQSYTDFFDFQ